MNPFSRNNSVFDTTGGQTSRLSKDWIGNPQIEGPVAATTPGIIFNTVTGLPAAAFKVAKDIGQGIARSAASAGLTIVKPFGGVSDISASDIKSPTGQELFKTFFGTEPVSAIEDRIAQAEIAIKSSPFAKKIGLDKAALPLAFGGVFGSEILDLTPVGGLEKNAVKTLAKEISFEGTLKILKSLNVPQDIAETFAPHFALVNDEKGVQDIFDQMKGVIGIKTQAEKTAIQPIEQIQKIKSNEMIHGVFSNDEKALSQNLGLNKQVDEAVQNQKSLIVDPDKIKLGVGDTSPENARVFSRQAEIQYDYALQNHQSNTVDIMMGGPGSGKSEIGVKSLSTSPSIIYDAPNVRESVIDRRIQKAKDAGKIPTINFVLNDVKDAYKYSLIRGIEQNRPTPANFFAESHAEAIDTAIKEIEKGAKLYLKDTRGIVDLNTAREAKWITNPQEILAKLREAKYSKDEILNQIKDVKLTGQQINRAKDSAKSLGISDARTTSGSRQAYRTDQSGSGRFGGTSGVQESSKITPLDRFIAEGKIKINREGTRDVYSYKKGNIWQRARDSDSAVKAVTPKEKVVQHLPMELEQKAISVAIQKETIENSPLNQLIKYASKTGENKGRLPEVLGGKINGSGAISKFGKKGDDIVTEVFGRNIDSETARKEFELFMARKQKLAQEDIALKQEIKDFRKSQIETQTTPVPQLQSTSLPEKVPIYDKGTGELRSLENTAQEQLSKSNLANTGDTFSLPHIVESKQTPVKAKINMLDYLRTPDRVLKKIGLEKNAMELRKAYEGYVKELPLNINKITEWSKEVPKESNAKIFKYLDGENIDLNPTEIKVVGEIKSWLKKWADRLNLPEDNRITNYVTHIFDEQLVKKEFDEDLAKIITDKVPGSVYDPFLLKRLGAKGYKQDAWAALDAYVKRGTRKAYMDEPLANLEEASKSLEKSQWDYVKKYADGINMRPTDFDNLFDNGIKQMIGYKLGQRPTTVITQFLRKMTYRGMLGLNLSSALRNISQGINTYAKLGEKYTVIGYSKLLSLSNYAELSREGIFAENLIEDRTISATKKAIEKIDKGLFFFFQQAEKINRGSAYLGAKAKAIAEGKTEEQAIEFGKKIVRDTQFLFSRIDTPVVMQSDIAKTLLQFQTFTTKQIEFITEMARNKEFAGLIRYGVAGLAFVYTIGQAFGMKWQDLIPIYRIGIPPSLKLPYETGSAVVNAPDAYGRQRTVSKKISDITNTLSGYIPAGTQIKKTMQGVQAIQKGGSYDKAGRLQFKQGQSLPAKVQSVLFGKYASQNAQNYFNRTSGSKTSKSSNPFSR